MHRGVRALLTFYLPTPALSGSGARWFRDKVQSIWFNPSTFQLYSQLHRWV